MTLVLTIACMRVHYSLTFILRSPDFGPHGALSLFLTGP